MKLQKFIQYAYLLIAIFFAYETFRNWNQDRDRAYMLMFFAVLAVFMYFFKKNFMKRFEDKTKK
ncbi:MAG: hypothetical protein R2797_12735 [Gelidibacter sp.]